MFWTQNRARRLAFIGVIAGGVIGAAMGSLSAAAPAAVSAGVSGMEKLVAENEINQQILLYTLLLDGDGINKRDVRTWADRLFTEDAVFETYAADGRLMGRQQGREEIFRQNVNAPALPAGLSARHFNVATYFDEVTPTTARVRTITSMLTVTKRGTGTCAAPGDEACGGRAVRVTSFTYHDVFTRTKDGWKKSHSVIRSDL